MFYAVLFFITYCSAQELPRRVYLGIKMEDLTVGGRQLLTVNALNGTYNDKVGKIILDWLRKKAKV